MISKMTSVVRRICSGMDHRDALFQTVLLEDTSTRTGRCERSVRSAGVDPCRASEPEPAVPACGALPCVDTLRSEDPILRVLILLAVSIGLPYFLLSATSPLTVPALCLVEPRITGRAPGLPFLVEPLVTLRLQSRGWSAAYEAFVLLMAASAFASSRSADAPSSSADREGGRPHPAARRCGSRSSGCCLRPPVPQCCWRSRTILRRTWRRSPPLGPAAWPLSTLLRRHL